MTLAHNHSNPLRLLPASEQLPENNLRKVESEEAKEETQSALPVPQPAMNMPKQPQGYIKAPLYDFF